MSIAIDISEKFLWSCHLVSKETNTFIQQGHIKLIKTDHKNIYNDLFFE